jgi:hypothetical protein
MLCRADQSSRLNPATGKGQDIPLDIGLREFMLASITCVTARDFC